MKNFICRNSLKVWILQILLRFFPAADLHADAFEDAPLYLAGVEGLQMDEDAEGKVILSGELERPSDMKKLQQFLKKHPEVVNETRLSDGAGEFLEQKLKRKLEQIAPQGRIERNGSQFHLTGVTSGDILTALRKIYPHIHLRKIDGPRNSIQPTIFLEIVLIEVKKTALRKLGSRLSPSFGIGTNIGLDLLQSKQAVAATSDPIRGFLDLAMQKGEARVHAKQSVVTQNGKSGYFQAGGEFPIKIVSGLVSRVEFKRFGLILKFTPHLQQSPYVHLEIESEMSEIDTGTMVDGIPTILKKDLRTQIFAKLDEMMAIGGIVRSSQSKHIDQIPGLSAIPVLGRLFESEDFKRNNSEAYLFITPRRMEKPWMPSPEL